MDANERLLQVAGKALGHKKPRLPLALARRYGAPAQELAALLSARNGFMAFDQALHVLPIGPFARGYELTLWNSDELWRSEYEDMAQGCLFFAEDVFGEQFCIADGAVWRFNPETGERKHMADSLAGWIERIFDDFVTETGYPLAAIWQERHGLLRADQRLVPHTPFVLGGQFTLDNLQAQEAVKGMRSRANVARKIRNLPNGSSVRLIIDED